jgi:hypothetical protein
MQERRRAKQKRYVFACVFFTVFFKLVVKPNKNSWLKKIEQTMTLQTNSPQEEFHEFCKNKI